VATIAKPHASFSKASLYNPERGQRLNLSNGDINARFSDQVSDGTTLARKAVKKTGTRHF
jgi:hypothetical protein